MSKLHIPQSQRDIVAKLLQLSDDKFESLTQRLSAARPVAGYERLSKQILPEIPEADREGMGEMLTGLFALFYAYEDLDFSVDKFTSSVISSVFPNLDEKESQKYAARLQTLLEMEGGVGLAAKALSLISERERLFRGARIISDIRPVFGRDLKAGIKGAVVTHTLRIRYLSPIAEGPKDWLIGLDDEDLQRLKKEVERAEAKAKIMRKLIADTKINALDED